MRASVSGQLRTGQGKGLREKSDAFCLHSVFPLLGPKPSHPKEPQGPGFAAGGQKGGGGRSPRVRPAAGAQPACGARASVPNEQREASPSPGRPPGTRNPVLRSPLWPLGFGFIVIPSAGFLHPPPRVRLFLKPGFAWASWRTRLLKK